MCKFESAISILVQDHIVSSSRKIMLNHIIFGLICIFAIIYHCIKSTISFCKSLLKRECVKNDKNKIIIITGCDSGFGRMLSEKLAKEKEELQSNHGEFTVVSLCLSQEAVEDLKKLGIHSIKCDVTSDEDVSKAKDSIQTLLGNSSSVLYALVNNAGIADSGYVIFNRDIKPFQKTMDVNFFGQLRVVQALLPLFLNSSKEYGGRIINISSVCGMSVMIGNSSYCASKYAVEAWSDGLRLELAPFNLKTVKVRPGCFNTKIQNNWAKIFLSKYQQASKQVQDLFGGKAYEEKLVKFFESDMFKGAQSPPVGVVNSLIDIIFKKHNKLEPYYCVGNDSKTLFKALHCLPTNVADSVKHSINFFGAVPCGCSHSG